MNSPDNKWDVVVIGSGFGGSVAALRLAQKGYRVAVLERGRRIRSEDFREARKSNRKLFWLPRLNMEGFFEQRVLRHIGVVGGVGVGGGSLVYGAVLLEPRSGFFQRTPWTDFEDMDWEKLMMPHYESARKMLGATQSPYMGAQHEALRKTARTMGAENTFEAITLGIDFDKCTRCGGCMIVGCADGAKRSLDQNYLAEAESLGVKIFPRTKAKTIFPKEGGYIVSAVSTKKGNVDRSEFFAGRVISAAGVLGTLELLFHCRDVDKTLPNISRMLGRKVRGNSEALVPLMARNPDVDHRYGPGISSHFFPDEHTHITNNRFSAGQGPLRFQVTPLIDENNKKKRTFKTLMAMIRHPVRATSPLLARNWHQRLSILTVMQDVDNYLSIRLKRGLGGRYRLVSEAGDNPPPSHIPVAHAAARAYAEHSDSLPLSLSYDSLGGIAPTAHILGGAIMAPRKSNGVVDAHGEVFGYPGLFVVDASIIPANVGVNPALSITALAEHCMAAIPENR